MQGRFAAHHTYHALVSVQGADGLLEDRPIHEEAFLVVAAESSAVRAFVVAGVGKLYLDYLHVRWRSHTLGSPL
jgi:hypothetical protein